MTVIASDAFTGTSGTELSAYDAVWSKASGTSSNAVISNANRARADATGVIRYDHSATPSSPDYSVAADCVRVSTSGTPSAGVTGRSQSGADTCYYAIMQETAGSTEGITLGKRVAGANTQIARDTSFSGASRHVRLTMTGTTLDVYVDGAGSPAISQTDASISTAGKAGLYLNNSSAPSDTTTYHIDNWELDDPGAGGGYSLTADAGSFALSGVAAILTRARILTAAAGSFALSGQDATLAYTPAAGAFVLDADPGAFSLSGVSAVLSASRILQADAGAFSLTGQDATLTHTPLAAYELSAAAGEFQLSGRPATLTYTPLVFVDFDAPSGGTLRGKKSRKSRINERRELGIAIDGEPVSIPELVTQAVGRAQSRKAAEMLESLRPDVSVDVSETIRKLKRRRDDETLLLM